MDSIDRTKPYASCAWLEAGLAFNRRSLHTCLVVHHGRGFPYLCDYNGGAIDMNVVQAARTKIIKENQQSGHDACRGCPHLRVKKWKPPKVPLKIVGIAQFTHCNIECSYCYLQTQDPESYKDGATPYKILPALQDLIAREQLATDVLVDWGGGEPTIYPEFDSTLELITRHGGTTWVHTNGTRLPKPIANGIDTKHINIICSVDAGSADVWKKIKRKNLFDLVWRNLDQYARAGCGVVLKYIVKDENCAESELRAFVERAAQLRPKEVVVDIDYDFPNPNEKIVNALRFLYRLSKKRGLHTTFGSTGALFTPEIDVRSRVVAPFSDRIRRFCLARTARLRTSLAAFLSMNKTTREGGLSLRDPDE